MTEIMKKLEWAQDQISKERQLGKQIVIIMIF